MNKEAVEYSLIRKIVQSIQDGSIIEKIFQKINNSILKNLYCKIVIYFPAKLKEKIVFDNFLGKGYAENPKYIAEEILRQDLKIDLVWVVSDLQYDVPPQIRKVKYGSWRALYEYATAKVWVDNVRNTFRPKKRNSQIYLQTWHGMYGFKAVEKSALNVLNDKYINKAIYDGKITDGILISGQLLKEICERDFWLSERTEYLMFGSPSCENLLSSINKNIASGDNIFNLSNEEQCTILYAPTFRDNNDVSLFLFDYKKICQTFENLLGTKCRFIIRFHPNTPRDNIIIEYDDQIIDGDQYSEYHYLLSICDILISDYSSVLFDFALLHKPAFIYAPDYEEYRNGRIITEVFEQSPFMFAKTIDDLMVNIIHFNLDEYLMASATFFERYPLFGDGKAAFQCVEWIKNKISYESFEWADCGRR